jgi:hypothetical protein
MGLSFLVPMFLAGLAAVAVPVVLHLINRQRTEVIEFPSLMFLQRIPFKTTRRRRIRDALLLALRALALILLAAAFARPFLDRPLPPGAAVQGAREVVILLDRSYSMGYGDVFERARSAARDAVNDLGPDDRATLILFDTRAAAVVRSSTDRARLRSVLDTVSVGSAATRISPALRLAQSILDPSELPRREAILISDFQRAGWDGRDATMLPPGAVLTPVDVSVTDPSNLSVTDVSFRREAFAGAERVTATVRVAAKGVSGFERVPVVLEIDGQQIGVETIALEANSSGSITFPPFTMTRRVRGTVRAGTDALPADNTFNFVLSTDQSIPVLILEGGDNQSATSLYLSRALGIGERPSFRTEIKPVSQLRAVDFETRSVIIFNDVGFPTGDLGRGLRDYVQRGGGVLMILGERVREASDLLPGTFAAPVDRGSGAVLASMDLAHPVFELFSAPRSGDFSAARFFRYRPFTLGEGATAVARFDDGGIALAEGRVGEGRILVWTSTMDTYWNDLSVQPVFLPLVHRLTRHLAGFAEPAPWFVAGQVVDLAGGRPGLVAGGHTAPETSAPAQSADPATPAGAPSASPRPLAGAAIARSERAVVSPSGERTEVGGPNPSFVELMEQGFYEVRALVGREEPYILAVNLDLAESDLSSVEPLEIVAAVTAPPDSPAVANADAGLSILERERRQSLWWYILFGTFLLLAAESVLANRRSLRPAQHVIGGERA